MARFMIEKAKSSGVPQEMGPLNPYARRLVHLTVAEDPEMSSESIGDAFLKTVIILGRGAEVRAIRAIEQSPMRQSSICNRQPSMFDLSDTIVAIATPPGRGGIGVVRLSGPDAQAVARAIDLGRRTDSSRDGQR